MIQMADDKDLDFLKQLIHEYETILPEITEQLHYYKREYSSIKREILNLSQENKALYQKLEDCASNHMAMTTYSFKDNDFIDNLKNQLNLSLKEKESVVELWRTSMTRIDYLESELKVYSAGTDSANKSFIRKMKKTYENELKTLRNKLKESQQQLFETTNISKTSLANKKGELEALNKSQQESQNQIQKLLEELEEFRRKYAALNETNETLKSQLAKQTKLNEQTNFENYNAKLKVAEACHIIEAALIEKDAAILRENEAKEEINKLTAAINEIVHETESKVKTEISRVKEEFANKMHSYKIELKKCQEDLAIKTLEYDKKNEWCKSLQNEINALKEGKDKIVQSVHKEKQVWSGKVEHNKEKLINSERKNVQLKQNLKHLQEILDKTKQMHNDDLCKVELEKKNLETQIHSLENDLQLSNARFHQVNAKVEDFSRRISSMDLQFKEELALKNAESERNLTERLNEVECVNARINEELKAQLSAQINLNQKWKYEVRNVTEKLEMRIRALKNELIKLRSKNADLIKRLEQSENKRLEYKENLKTLCTEFNSIANIKL